MVNVNCSIVRYAYRIPGAALLLLLAGVLAMPNARAELIAGGTLVEQSALVSGSATTIYSFAAPSSGTLTVHLENLAWPERLVSLNCSVFSPEAVLGAISGTNDLRLSVGIAGNYYARVSGTAAGLLNLGLYSVRISFAPGVVSAVPLPASFGMLILALALLATQWRAGRNESVMYGA